MLFIVPRLVLSLVNLPGVTQSDPAVSNSSRFMLLSAQRQPLTRQLVADWILVLIAVVNEFKYAEITASYSPNPSGNALCLLRL